MALSAHLFQWIIIRWSATQLSKAGEHRRRISTEEKAKVIATVWGTEKIQFLVALAIQDDVKKRMNRIKATWRNGCFDKTDVHPVHYMSNHQPSKMDVLPKTFVQTSLLHYG